MKRSEMLDILVFSIELHAGNDPSWLEHDAKVKARAYEYAHRILQDLEEAGMLPPPKELENVTARIKYYYSHDEVDEDVTFHTNPRLFWETE